MNMASVAIALQSGMVVFGESNPPFFGEADKVLCDGVYASKLKSIFNHASNPNRVPTLVEQLIGILAVPCVRDKAHR